MGKRKIEIKKIENTVNRQITFYKRKKGIIKKVIELSILCNIDVFLIILDEKKKASIVSTKDKIFNFFNLYLNNQNYIEIKENFNIDDYGKEFSKIKKNKFEPNFSIDKCSNKNETNKKTLCDIKNKFHFKIKIPKTSFVNHQIIKENNNNLNFQIKNNLKNENKLYNEIKQNKTFSQIQKLNNNNFLKYNNKNKTNLDSLSTNYATQKINLSNQLKIENNYNIEYSPNNIFIKSKNNLKKNYNLEDFNNTFINKNTNINLNNIEKQYEFIFKKRKNSNLDSINQLPKIIPNSPFVKNT